MTTAIQLLHYFLPMVEVADMECLEDLHHRVHVPIASNKFPIFQSTRRVRISSIKGIVPLFVPPRLPQEKSQH